MGKAGLAAALAATLLPSCAGIKFRVVLNDLSVVKAARAASAQLSDGGDTLTGRVRLYMSRNSDTPPSEACSDDQDTAQVFGVDVFDFGVGSEVVIDEAVLGYPRPSLAAIENTGTYFVQAELFLYDKYERSGLPAVWMPATCVSAGGANGAYAKPDGTPYSDVVKLELHGKDEEEVALELSNATPAAVSPGCAGLGDGVDSDWIKTVRVPSALLSEFWGRNVSLEACVLVPLGLEDAEHANATYPLVIAHGHYSPLFSPGGEFSETKPDCDPEKEGYDCVDDLYAYYLDANWTSSNASVSAFNGSRMIVMTVNHPVPLFDDSYAVNSASLGPYGDAIVTELVPEVERRFRGIGEGWARGLMGGSTGGWESIGVQVLYPDDFNSAYAACPDPITFTSYATLDIYSEANAYYYDSPFKRTERPGQRDSYSGTTWPGYGHPYGQTSATVKEMNHRELVLGTHSRSCGQWDIWEAVFGPVCEDGFPCRLYDKFTGAVNSSTAAYWKEHFDLAAIMARDWETLGPKLQGKINIFVGNSDTFFLTDAVYDMEDFLSSTTSPASDAQVTIGVHKGRGYEHCFRGYEYDATTGEPLPNSITRLTYNQAFLPKMAAHFAATAPEGADVSSWRY